VVDGYTYDVFGAIRSQSGSSDNYWLFTGEQLDSDEGLYYLRARHYDPEIGRFLSRDPLPGAVASPLTLQRYGYAFNNPTNWVDPSGLCPLYNPQCIASKIVGRIPTSPYTAVPWRSGRTQLFFTCLIYAGTGECRTVERLGELAFKFQDEIYGENTEGTAADRFQHCFWSASIAVVEGSSFAKTITDRYEEYPSNDPIDKAFDLESNRLGIRFVKDVDYETNSFGLPEDLEAVISQIVGYCQGVGGKE
jgi:RHS repeat-associated protein